MVAGLILFGPHWGVWEDCRGRMHHDNRVAHSRPAVTCGVVTPYPGRLPRQTRC